MLINFLFNLNANYFFAKIKFFLLIENALKKILMFILFIIPIRRDILNDQCLNEFVKYVFSIFKRSPTLIDLKRYLIKTEIDQQIAIKNRDEEIFTWENNRNNIV